MRIIEDAHRDEAIVAFVKIGRGFVGGFMDHGLFLSLFSWLVNPGGLGFPVGYEPGESLKMERGQRY